MGVRQTPWGTAPDGDAIEAIARRAIARLPDRLRGAIDGIVLMVEEFADDETLDEMGVDDPFALSGLYRGRPLTARGGDETGALPDMIHLYRRAILDEWAEGDETLEALVAHVVIHEIGHHFGLSDADMAAIEAAAG